MMLQGMNDLPIDKVPPNVQLLQRSKFGKRLPTEPTQALVEELDLFNSRFPYTLFKVLTEQK